MRESATTLVLLRDPGICGSRRGLLGMVLAVGWGRALRGPSLPSSRRPRGAARAARCNLCSLTVRGCGSSISGNVLVRVSRPPVLTLSPSSVGGARRIVPLPILAQDFVQTFVRCVLIDTSSALGRAAGWRSSRSVFAFLGRGLLSRSAFSFTRHCRCSRGTDSWLWVRLPHWHLRPPVVALGYVSFPMLVNATWPIIRGPVNGIAT